MQKGTKIVAGCIVGALGMAAMSGCGDEDVRSYQAPKSPSPPAVTGAEPQLPAGHPPIPGVSEVNPAHDHDHDEQRLLAAIVTHGQRTWFFKLVGPIEAVSNQAEVFADFIQSLRFPADAQEPLRWKLPAGWTQLPASGMRFATLQIGAGPSPLEITVFALGGEAGGMLSNINRWRGQLALPPITEADLPKETRVVDQEGHPITLVEMIGRGSGKMTPPGAPQTPTASIPTRPAPPPLLARPDAPQSAPAPIPAPAAPASAAGAPGETVAGAVKLTYDTPQGWQTLPPSGPRLLSLAAGDAQVAVTQFPGDVGGMLANVNRWRGQVGLAPIAEDGLKDAVQPIDLGPLKGGLVELYGADATDAKRPGLLAVSLQRDGMTWFFKMAGPAAAVQQQRAAFQVFIKSVKFAPTGAADAK